MLSYRCRTVPRSGWVIWSFIKRADVEGVILYSFWWQLADIEVKEIHWALDSSVGAGINWYCLAFDAELFEGTISIL